MGSTGSAVDALEFLNPLYIVPAGATYRTELAGDVASFPVIQLGVWREARMPVAIGTGGKAVAFSFNLATAVAGDFPQLTETKLVFDKVELDTDNGTNGTGYVVQKSGIYSLNARVRFNGKNPNNLMSSRIFIKKGSIKKY